MPRRVGRYTKQETTELISMFNEGLSVYKICKSLNRSQKSISNNLIRLNLIDGEITPEKNKKLLQTKEKKLYISGFRFNYFKYILYLFILTSLMVIKPNLNPVEIFVFVLVDYF